MGYSSKISHDYWIVMFVIIWPLILLVLDWVPKKHI